MDLNGMDKLQEIIKARLDQECKMSFEKKRKYCSFGQSVAVQDYCWMCPNNTQLSLKIFYDIKANLNETHSTQAQDTPKGT
jgi:hypothetical protein